MASEIVNDLRKTVKEFFTNNELYCDHLDKAEDLRAKDNESNNTEAQKETSAINASSKGFRDKILQLQARVEKSIIRIDWLSNTFGNITNEKDLSSRECYYQSLDQVKKKAELLDRCLVQYDEYLASEAKKRTADKSINTCIVTVFIIIIIVAFVLIISDKNNRNQQNSLNTMTAESSQAGATVTQQFIASGQDVIATLEPTLIENNSNSIPIIPEPTQVSCSGAPPIIIEIGNSAHVTSNCKIPIYMRLDSVVGTNVEQYLYEGDELNILQGPECSNDVSFFLVEAPKYNKTGWVAEAEPDSNNYCIQMDK